MELKVNNFSIPSTITFNFEELKQELEEKAVFYTNLVYTDEQIKEAKADKASMNKLKNALNDERIRMEKEYMKPFTEFKAQVNEIIGIIDKPVNAIDTQIKAYEDKCRQDKQVAIEQYFAEIEKPEWLTLRVITDPKWLNASVTLKSVKAAIDEKVQQIIKDMEMLSKIPEFGFEATEVYKTTLNVNKAFDEANRMAEIARRKREREEAERLAAEKAAAEAAEKAALEATQVENEPEQAEVEPVQDEFIMPDIDNDMPFGEECIIPESGTYMTFKALLTTEDKTNLMQWMKDRMIQFEVLEMGE